MKERVMKKSIEDMLGKTVTTIYGETAQIVGVHIYYSLRNGGAMSVKYYLRGMNGYFKRSEIMEVKE